jgi:hypothetical protein
MTRKDMDVLTEYGISIDRIAHMRGAKKTREREGDQEYWTLAYSKREDCHDIIFFVDRNDGTNSVVNG